MNDRERVIYDMLEAHPDEAFVDLEANTLYCRGNGGLIELSPVEKLSNMSDDEINEFLVDSLKQLNW